MKKLIVLSVLTVLTLVGCQKQPKADFSTDKSTYISGETIHLTNTTLNGKSFKWTMPDGQILNSESVDYTTSQNNGNTPLLFKLEAFSKNGKKTSEVAKSIPMSPATGNVTFWQITNSGYSITTVSLNGLTSDITSEYNSSPTCADSGNATFYNLEVGDYSFTATDGTYNWSGTVQITKDGCTSMQLQ